MTKLEGEICLINWLSEGEDIDGIDIFEWFALWSVSLSCPITKALSYDQLLNLLKSDLEVSWLVEWLEDIELLQYYGTSIEIPLRELISSNRVEDSFRSIPPSELLLSLIPYDGYTEHRWYEDNYGSRSDFDCARKKSGSEHGT